MPGFDGSGPAGRGAGTGGGRGFCSGARRRPGRFGGRAPLNFPPGLRRDAGLRRLRVRRGDEPPQD